jgi:hypothetical protein
MPLEATPTLLLLISHNLKINMAEARSCKVEATTAPLNTGLCEILIQVLV